MSGQIMLSPSVRVSPAASDPSMIACWGEGAAHGDRVLLNDKRLVGWLFSLVRPESEISVRERAVHELSLSEAEAAELVETLLAQGLLVAPRAPDPTEVAWEEVGWRDALAFHQATADLPFEPNYEQYKDSMAAYLEQAERDGDHQPGPFKEVCGEKFIELARGDALLSQASFRETLLKRRPFSSFAQRPVSLRAFEELMEHVFGATGVSTKSILGPHLRKTSPSGGARHPIEAYVAALDVDGLEPALYHYSVRRHGLSMLRTGPLRQELHRICFQKSALLTASIAFFFSCRWQRHMWKYRYGRSYRMVHYDVGHLVQTQTLAAACLGLTTFSCPSFHDLQAGEFLGIADNLEEAVLHITAVGPNPL